MGQGWFSVFQTEDPWTASAFFFAFMHLLLALLVLSHTMIACITSQLVRWYGWEYPSQSDSTNLRDRTGRLNSGFLKANMSTPTRRTRKISKRDSYEDWQAVRNGFFTCAKCNGVWKSVQGVSFRYDKGASVQSREKVKYLDANNFPVERFPFAGSGIKRYADYGSERWIEDKVVGGQKVCVYVSDSSSELQKSSSLGRACDNFDEAGHQEVSVETNHDNSDMADERGLSLNTPVYETPRFVTNVVKDGDDCRDLRVEDVVSSSKEPNEKWLSKIASRSAYLKISQQKSESSLIAQEELQQEMADESFNAVPTKENGEKNCSLSDMMNSLQNEQNHSLKTDEKCFTTESVILGLKEAIVKEREKLGNLYAELETERISSETAANEAMSMISRLQEEKASLRMQAAHYRRIAEERAIYDDQAMQFLKEILIKKEKENFLLQKEVDAMRSNCQRDAGACGKRKKSVDRRSLFLECQQSSLTMNEGDEDILHSSSVDRRSLFLEWQQSSLTMNEGDEDTLYSSSVNLKENLVKPMKPFSPLSRIEKQPSKILKGNSDHVSLPACRVFTESGVHTSTEPILPVASDDFQESVTVRDAFKEDMERGRACN